MRSEWIKLRTTRSTVLLAGIVAVFGVLAGQVLTMPIADDQWVAMHRHPFLAMFALLLSVFAFVAGARIATEEFAHNTITWTTLATPRRARIVARKAIIAAAYGAVLGALATAIATTIVLVWASSGPVEVAPSDAVPLIGWAALLCAGWALVGVGLAFVMRHQTGTITTGIVWILIGEAVLGTLLKENARYLPGAAGQGMFGTPAPDLLTRGSGGALFGSIVAGLVVAGAMAFRRRDITA